MNNNLPPSSGRGPPPFEATNAVLTSLLRAFTDEQSLMPLPMELLEFVGLYNPELAEALYQLKFGGSATSQRLTGEAIEEFIRNWSPEVVAAALAGWHPGMDPTGRGSPDVVHMAPPTEFVAADAASGNGITFTLSSGLASPVSSPPREPVVDNSATTTTSQPAGQATPTPSRPRPELNLNWATIPSSPDGPITASRDILAGGKHEEWNRLCVSWQMVVGHLDHGHVEPAGLGFINVLDYMVYKVYRLGILPDSAYVDGDPLSGGRVTYVPVALRDKRNFWAQFYYFTRYVLTEQLLRAKAVEAILLLRETTGGAPGRNPLYLPKMGPDYWWVFGRKHDQAWETYFRHIFSNKALPEYLKPWFSEEEEKEATAATAAADAATTSEGASNVTEAMDEEKENTAPEDALPDLMSYATVTRMRQCLEAIGERLYTGDDKPSQGASDNLLPEMFFDNLLSLAHQCTSNHPWAVEQIPVVCVGLQRLGEDQRGLHMNPLEFYGPTL